MRAVRGEAAGKEREREEVKLNRENGMNQNQDFAGPAPVEESRQIMTQVASAREAQEVQAMVVLAKKFPRDQKKSMDNITIACGRPQLAEVASYEYSRGGTDITGPSIRLAEAIAQSWGNLIYGTRELEQRDNESTVEAFAWDIETNTRASKVFQVPHARYTKAAGLKSLVDPRDIYEAVANNAARRVRSCILAIIPRDVTDAAVEECGKTITAKVELNPTKIEAMVKSFEQYSITKEMIETRLQRNMDTITPAQYLHLVRIGTSIKDGMSKPSDWFQTAESKNSVAPPKAKSEGQKTEAETQESGKLKKEFDELIELKAHASKKVQDSIYKIMEAYCNKSQKTVEEFAESDYQAVLPGIRSALK